MLCQNIKYNLTEDISLFIIKYNVKNIRKLNYLLSKKSQSSLINVNAQSKEQISS